MPEITVACHAKLNLALEILRRREDGFHDLSTVFQAVGIEDTLHLRLTPSAGPPQDELTVSGIAVPIEGNLVLRAIAAFREALGLSQSVRATLHKQIPTGAGLGGGSSDAAGTLWGLGRLVLKPEAPGGAASVRARLFELAAGLGSDVAFFLGAGTALGQGRGELLAPLPTPEGWLVVAKPDVAVNTAEAYGLLGPEDWTDGTRTGTLAAKLRAGYGLREVAPDLYNGFAAPVERRWPQIRVLRERLTQLGAVASVMTGSGAAVFGVFEDQTAAERAAARVLSDGSWAAVVQPSASGLVEIDICD